MSGISVLCGYLLNTIDVGADRTQKCQTDCVGKIFMTATESTNTSECRNTDKTAASSLANFNSHSKIKPDEKDLYEEMVEVKWCPTQSCPALCDPMGCSLPGSSVHGILQARLLEWLPMPFSRGSFWPREWTLVSCIAGRFFTIWATREIPNSSIRIS